MAHNRCLVCYKSFLENKHLEPYNDHEKSVFLGKDLHVIFVLRTLFEVPYEALESYLSHDGNPSEWNFCLLCAQCGEAVENAKRIHQEIVEASRIFAAVKGEIVETVRRSWRRHANNREEVYPVEGAPQFNLKRLKAMRKTRKFVFDHKYGATSDPFIDGDILAGDLNKVEVKLDLPDVKVFNAPDVNGDAGPEHHEDYMYNDLNIDDNEDCNFNSDTEGKPLISDSLLMAPNDTEVGVTAEDQELISIFEDSIKKQKIRFNKLSKKMSKSVTSIENKNRSSKSALPLRKGRPPVSKDGRHPEFQKSETHPSTDKLIRLRAAPTRVYVCENKKCHGKTFRTPGRLTIHQMQHHLGVKPFQCTWPGCLMRFVRSDVLRRHHKGHSEDYPFKCQYCPNQYNRKDNFKCHMEVRHRDKPIIY